ncbi:unnamed protein product [Caenorhabditis bovis]|uniref:Uncharacterized protein n=1 Tax=Caenorhabditis bovis TaxID=2654633 RepID=A0A8S1F5Q3_9PELO|nr:unnamed protein product [Caenorhabditis bovis]
MNPIYSAVLLIVLGICMCSSAVAAQNERPIFMDRREASPFGDILTEIKGKGLGGRMRFGKRSGYRAAYYEPQAVPEMLPF